jgi:capsular exopolysaccharide synthesis family protein
MEQTKHKSGVSSRPQSQPTLELGLRDYVEILFRWRWVILGTTLLLFAGSALYTYTSDFIYETSVIVQITKKPTSGMMMPNEEFMNILAPSQSLMKEIGILKSRGMAEEVVNSLKRSPVATLGGGDTLEILRPENNETGATSFARHEVILGRLENSVFFETDEASSLIHIFANSVDPKESAIIANTYAEVYHRSNIDMSRRALRSARELLERTIETKKKLLEAVEDSLRVYRENYPGVQEQSVALIQSTSAMEAQKAEVEIDIQTTTNLVRSYREQIAQLRAGMPKNIEDSLETDARRMNDMVASYEVQRILQQIDNLEQEVQNVRVQNPDPRDEEIVKKRLEDLQAKIKKLRAELQVKTQTGTQVTQRNRDKLALVREMNVKLTEAQIRLQSLEIRRHALEESIRTAEAKFQGLPRITMNFARLERTKLTVEKVYVTLEEKYQSALVAEQSEFGYVEILQRALPPVKFISPNIPKNLTFGFFLGLVVGIAVVFFINHFDDRIHKPEDIKRKGFSVLTVIPVLDSKAFRSEGKTFLPQDTVDGERGTMRRQFLEDDDDETDEESAPLHTIEPSLITAINPYSRISDSYRRLRTSVQYWKKNTNVRSLVITSGSPQEGKSITTANLAITFAQAKKRTLLIDVDLRRPTQHDLFKLKLEPGLTEILFGEADKANAIRPTFVENLEVLTAGAIPLNPAELIGSQTMKKLAEEFAKEYDIVIYDSPPILLFTDAELLVSMVDAVVFVVKMESTTFTALDHSVDIIEGIRMNLTGVVANSYVLSRMHRGYYHLHGDYHYYTDRYKYRSQKKS